MEELVKEGYCLEVVKEIDTSARKNKQCQETVERGKYERAKQM
jgi:hypothetical protein